MAGEADAADPTELAGVAEADTELAGAWSLDDADEDYPLTGSWEDPERRWTPRRITGLAVVVSVAILGAAGGAIWWQLRQPRPVHTTKVVVATETTTVVAAPPKQPIPSRDMVDPRKSPHVQLLPVDEQFVSDMRSNGYVGNIDDLIAAAKSVCFDLQHGKGLDEISQKFAAEKNLSVSQSRWFASEVQSTYPSCHNP